MTVSEREAWWSQLTYDQRSFLLKTASCSKAQIFAFKQREWYQLSSWIRRVIIRFKHYQLAVPLPKSTPKETKT